MKLQRLHGRKVNDLVLRKGKVWKGNTLVVRFIMGPPKNSQKKEGVFVGVLTSLKLNKSAVKRNKMRRRCREALRKAIKEYQDFSTVQLLLCPRSSSLTCTFSEIVKDVEEFLSSLPKHVK